MQQPQLKGVFIYNETYPLPKESYGKYKSKVEGCSGNPMCLNNVKSDVESYIAKWGRKNAIKIEDDDSSSFVILSDEQNFTGDGPATAPKKTNHLKVIGTILLIVFAILALKNKSIIYGLLSVGLIFYFYRDKIGFPAKS